MGKAMYGDHPPERLRAKLQRFDDRMRKVQETSEKRRQHAFDASQVAARDRFAGQQLVEVRVMREGKRKLARISGPGYGSSAQVKLPTHLNKAGAVYQIPASALRQSSANRFEVASSAIRAHRNPRSQQHPARADASTRCSARCQARFTIAC